MEQTGERPVKMKGLLIFSIIVCVAGNSLLYGYNIGILNATSKSTFLTQYRRLNTGMNGDAETNSNLTDTALLANASKEELNGLWADGIGPTTYVLYGFFGTIVSVRLSRRYCKNILIVGPALLFIASISAVVLELTRIFFLFEINRMFTALHGGIGVYIAFKYITGIVPRRDRLFAVKCHQLSTAIGFLLCMIFVSLQHFGHEYRLFVLFGFIAAVTLAFVLTFPFCPESPIHLFKMGDENKTKTVLRKLRGENDVEDEIEEIREERSISLSLKRLALEQLITIPELRKSVIAEIIPEILHQCAGPSVIMIYSNIIFTRAGLQESMIPFLNIALGLFLCIGVVISWKGVRTCFKMKWCMVVAAIILTVSLSLHKPKDEITITSVMSILALLLYMLCYPKAFGSGSSLNLGFSILSTASQPITDDFPDVACRKMRNIVNFVGILFNAAFILVFPSLENYLQSYTYIIFAVALLASILTTWLINPKKADQGESSSNDGSLERLTEENERLREVIICVRCNSKKKSILYNQCGHILYCSSCDIAEYRKICPTCEEQIKPYTHVKWVPDAPLSLQDVANIEV